MIWYEKYLISDLMILLCNIDATIFLVGILCIIPKQHGVLHPLLQSWTGQQQISQV